MIAPASNTCRVVRAERPSPFPGAAPDASHRSVGRPPARSPAAERLRTAPALRRRLRGPRDATPPRRDAPASAWRRCDTLRARSLGSSFRGLGSFERGEPVDAPSLEPVDPFESLDRYDDCRGASVGYHGHPGFPFGHPTNQGANHRPASEVGTVSLPGLRPRTNRSPMVASRPRVIPGMVATGRSVQRHREGAQAARGFGKGSGRWKPTRFTLTATTRMRSSGR